MSFKEAIDSLKEGSRIKRNHWNNPIWVVEFDITCLYGKRKEVDNTYYTFYPNNGDRGALDWITI